MSHAYRRARIVHRMLSKNLSEHEDGVDILAMGDLHAGDSHCDLQMVHEAVKWLQSSPNRYALIAGDLFNAALKDSVSDV